MLKTYNSDHLITLDNVTGIKEHLKALKSVLTADDDRLWFDDMWNDKNNPNGNKTRTYRLHKQHANGPEQYTTINLSRHERRAISQLRSGTLPLKIETGRWQGVDLNDRGCSCGQAIESEIHFLIDCQHYGDERNDLFTSAKNIFSDFETSLSLVKYCNILCSDNLQRLLGKTLIRILIKRRSIVDIH